MFREILRGGLVAGALKTGVNFMPALAQRRYRALDLRFTFANVAVDLPLMSEIKSNRSLHLLKAEEEEFWRIVSGESPALKEYTMQSRETRAPAT